MDTCTILVYNRHRIMIRFLRSYSAVVWGVVLIVGVIVLSQATPLIAHAQGAQTGISQISPEAFKTSCSGFFEKLGCDLVRLFFFDFWYSFTQWMAHLTAVLADETLWLSVQSTTYQMGGVIDNAWVITRDISNIFLLFGLLFIGFKFIVQDDGKARKLLVRFLLAALLINFSLFGAKLILDGFNIGARAIYTQIEVTGIQSQDVNSNVDDQNSGKTEISSGILSLTNPQTLFAKGLPTGGNINAATFIWVYFLAGILNIMLIFIFLGMGIFFVARIVGVIFMIILVPLAITLELVPMAASALGDKNKFLTWDGWFSDYIKLCAQPAVYIFFLYIIIIFVGKTSSFAFTQYGLNASSDWALQLLSVTVPMLMMYFMIKMARSITTGLSTQIGSMVSSGVSSVVSWAGGLALGGLALGGSLLGGLASRRAGSQAERLAAQAANETDETKKAALARRAAAWEKRSKYLGEQATYDVRNISVPGLQRFGIPNTLGGALATGSGIDVGRGTAETFKTRSEKWAKDSNREKKTQEQNELLTGVYERLRQQQINSPAGQEARREREAEANRMDSGTGATVNYATQATSAERIALNYDLGVNSFDAGFANESISNLTTTMNLATTTSADRERIQTEIAQRRTAIATAEKEKKDAKWKEQHEFDKKIGELESELEGLETITGRGLTNAEKQRVNKLKKIIKDRKDKKEQIKKDIEEGKIFEDSPIFDALNKDLKGFEKQLAEELKKPTTTATKEKIATLRAMITKQQQLMEQGIVDTATAHINSHFSGLVFTPQEIALRKSSFDAKRIQEFGKRAQANLIENEVQLYKGYFASLKRQMAWVQSVGVGNTALLGVAGVAATAGVLAAPMVILGAAAAAMAAAGITYNVAGGTDWMLGTRRGQAVLLNQNVDRQGGAMRTRLRTAAGLRD